MAVAAILNSKKIIFLVTMQLGSISDVVYQISSKSDNFSLRYGDLTIFKMAAVRHLKICIFCPVAFVSMPFCFLIEKFAEIGQSVSE